MCLFWLLDYVPFVGTVKNMLECVIAIFHGDVHRVVQKLIFAGLGGVLDIFAPKIEAHLFQFGVLAEKGVQIAVKKGVQRTTYPVVFNVFGRIVYHQIQNQIQKPSKRGEHVINNVFRVYRDIVRTFVHEEMGDSLDNMIKSERLSKNSCVVKDIKHPIPDCVKETIADMRVFIDEPHYFDTNSRLYGQEIEKLRKAVVADMKTIYDHFLVQNVEHLQGLGENVEKFIAGDYFVDREAKKRWLSKSENTEQEFKTAHQEVIKMFQRLKYDGRDCMLATWVKELVEAQR